MIAEQLARLAKIDRAVTVEAAPGDDDRDGLGYRTRITLMAGEDGRAGMRRYRSHDVVALTDMPLATAQVAELAAGEKVFRRRWTPGSRLELIAPANGAAPMLLVDGAPWRGRGPDRRANARRTVTETVTGAAGRGGDQPRAEWTYRLAADGFWQVHREAPGLLVDAVLAGVGDVDGARVLDLYSGAGLFSLPLAQAVGASGRLTTVEGDAVAVKNARRNLHRFGQVDLRHGPVDRVLRDGGAGGERPSADVVVLDPPRVGAGRAVVESIAALRPSRVVYVACDPAAFARDAGYLAGHGYVLEQMRAFDLFPHTHHVEIVAVFTHEKLS